MPFRKKETLRLLPAVSFAVSALAYFPFSQWISTTRVGTAFFLWGQMAYILPLMAAIIATPVLVICLFFKRISQKASTLLLLAVLFVLSCIGGIKMGHITRMAGMRSFAKRSASLVDAIHKYEQDNSAPPESLTALVPDYLAAVPFTGMMAYPKYRYYTGETAQEHYGGNTWALSVFTPSGGINFDEILYFPNLNYPKHGFGGVLERIDDWAYVHE